MAYKTIIIFCSTDGFTVVKMVEELDPTKIDSFAYLCKKALKEIKEGDLMSAYQLGWNNCEKKIKTNEVK